MLQVGDAAPDFSLRSTSGSTVNLADHRGKKIVLYFYPKDDTPGCTREACSFRDNMSALQSAGAIVLGVSKDSIESHQRFTDKYGLPFPLLSDPNNAVAKKYGAFGEKNMYGKMVTGTIRTTVVIDEQGITRAVWSPVRVDGHTEQVLAVLRGDAAPPAPKAKKAAKNAKTAGGAKPKKATKKKVGKTTAKKALPKKAPSKKTASKKKVSKGKKVAKTPAKKAKARQKK